MAGSVVLIDLWGRHSDGGIPADQTWMGFLGRQPPERVSDIWSAVRGARDAAIEFLSERAGTGEPVRGWEVDEVARRTLAKTGLDEYFIHRLGHSIDHDLTAPVPTWTIWRHTRNGGCWPELVSRSSRACTFPASWVFGAR